jgi:hypothetical protein
MTELERAASAGDLDALEAALAARSAAIAELQNSSPSPALAVRLETELKAGDAALETLQSLKLQLGLETVRMAQLRSGLVTGLDGSPNPHFDYLG